MTRDVLRLASLSMHNFRNYRNVDLNFSQDPKKTITIFHGSMSSGKTTIMNAIHWCLYGKEPHFINEGEGKPIINQKALNETELAKSTEATVEITFSTNERVQIGIKRSVVAYRETDLRTKIFNSEINGLIDAGFKIEQIEQVFSYIDSDAGGWQYVKNKDAFEAQVERLLPESLSAFVFFNGETLDKFFSTLHKENIRNGIEHVSGLGIVDNTIEHLKEIEATYRKKAMIDQGDLTYQIERKDTIQTKLNQLIPQLSENKLKESEFYKDQARLKDILKNNTETVIREEEFKLTQADATKENLKELLNKNRKERRDFVSSLFGKVLLLEPIKECLSVLQDAEEKGLTPPPIDSNYMREKLGQNKCICGNDLSEGSQSREQVEKLLARFIDSEIASEAIGGRILISEILETVPNKEAIIEHLNNYREDRKKYNQLNITNDSIREGIFHKLKEYNIEEIKKLGKQLEEVDGKLIGVKAIVLKLQEQIEELQRKMNEVDIAVDKATEKSEKARYWKERQNLAKEAREAIEQLREVILNEIRSKVEKGTNEIFKKLIYRRWQLDKVEISNDYRIKVLDKEGVDNLRTLSAGQTLYLSLSFISALRNVTAVNYPMVIDSPFGKVSGQERVWAAEDLPKFLPDTQITFLVTDTEYSSNVSNIYTNKIIPSIRDVLMKNENVWKEYNLVLVNEDTVSSKTEIINVE